jgi:hypothetical protein
VMKVVGVFRFFVLLHHVALNHFQIVVFSHLQENIFQFIYVLISVFSVIAFVFPKYLIIF